MAETDFAYDPSSGISGIGIMWVDMNIELLLILSTIGLPIIGALLLWRWGNDNVHAQRWSTAITLGVTGLLALTLFLISEHSACTFMTGKGNCVLDGLSALSVVLISVVSASVSALRESNERYDHKFMLLLSSTWAGLMLTGNYSWLMSLIFLALLLIVVGRWIRARGSSVTFFFSRHEYNPDYPDNQDDERPMVYQRDEWPKSNTNH